MKVYLVICQPDNDWSYTADPIGVYSTVELARAAAAPDYSIFETTIDDTPPFGKMQWIPLKPR